MPWVRIDDHFPEHPKVARLDDSGLAMFVAGLAYCNRNLTDGFIPAAVAHGQLRLAGGNPMPVIHQLENVGLWHAVDGGWMVHDYLDYQPSREQVEEERAQKIAAGRIGAAARAQARAERVLEHPGSTSFSKTAAELQPDPVPNPKPNPEPTALEHLDHAFETFWATYPRKVGKPKAKSAFDRAKRRAGVAEIIAGTTRYADDPNRADEFTAHPTTWLNRDGWADAPLPARNGRPTKDRARELAERAISTKRAEETRTCPECLWIESS